MVHALIEGGADVNQRLMVGRLPLLEGFVSMYHHNWYMNMCLLTLLAIINFVEECMGNYSILSKVSLIPQSIHKHVPYYISLCPTTIAIHVYRLGVLH